jgi:capsular exopolysaccharide synthesis family protein
MDTTDRPNANLPARIPDASLRLPSSIPVVPRELAVSAAPPPSSINVRTLVHGLARHWWHILLIWLVFSVPLVYLVYRFVKPTYRAVAQLQIESKHPDLFGPLVSAREAGGPQSATYLQTEVETIKSRRTLDRAMRAPGLRGLPMIRNAEDPVADLQEVLEVTILPNSHYVEIALESDDPKETFLIVNAIVEAYSDMVKTKGNAANQKLEEDLKKYQKDVLTPKIELTKERLTNLAKEGELQPTNSTGQAQTDATGTAPASPAASPEALEQYKTAKNKLMQTQFDLIELEAQYQTRLKEMQERGGDADTALASSGEPSNSQIQEQLEEEFLRDPEVASLIAEINATQEELEHTTSVAKKGHDPARVGALRHLASLKAEYQRLWTAKKEPIRRRLLTATSASGAPGAESLSELKAMIESRKITEKRLEKIVADSKVVTQDSQKDTVEFKLLQDDLEAYRAMDNQINRKLHEVQFAEDKSDILLYDPVSAVEPKTPSNNKRWKYMAVLPVGVLFAVIGMFLLLEVKAERVADPDLLSSRVGSEVFSLPPLPRNRTPESRSLNGPTPEDQLDRFIQRLDHLRFAICGDHHETGLGRCVLVTSAIGGEGKTTLAAQLAARCGNAGISTLLIDADLRRASLCPLLEVAEGPGLSDVLRNEANVDEVAVAVQGGAFYLLCAGTPLQDPSRVFQGRGLAMLLAELRQKYEMIIIDSPPILPVPDALIMGRWTDGALLAARFDVSRSPQVERARRQLDTAGIPVLGTVINGLRYSDSYYGRYTYSRQRTIPPSDSTTPEPDSTTPESESAPTV